MDRAPICALSQTDTYVQNRECFNLLLGLTVCPPSCVCGTDFLERRAAFLLSLPFTFYHVRFGPLFHPVKLFWVLKYVPSHRAAKSSRHHELLNLPAQRPYRKEMRHSRIIPSDCVILLSCQWTQEDSSVQSYFLVSNQIFCLMVCVT